MKQNTSDPATLSMSGTPTLHTTRQQEGLLEELVTCRGGRPLEKVGRAIPRQEHSGGLLGCGLSMKGGPAGATCLSSVPRTWPREGESWEDYRALQGRPWWQQLCLGLRGPHERCMQATGMSLAGDGLIHRAEMCFF